MFLQSLYLKNFRLYKEREFSFSPHFNLIVGPNAKGKTTILEALHVAMVGSSFRTTQLKEMIREGEEAFFLELSFVKHGIQQVIRFSYDGLKRTIFHNATSYASAAPLIGIVNGTAMVPDDVSMVKGGPAQRRQYLDQQISQIDPLYVHHLMRYYRALKQRNHLLKKKSIQAIEVWEKELAKAAAYLVQKRMITTSRLEIVCENVASTLSSGKEKMALKYQSKGETVEDLEAFYVHAYQKNRPRELALGYSLVGPHRDDLKVFLEGREVRDYGSEGQQRSCVAALRLAEWKLMACHLDVTPVMLIDDIGISFDEQRRQQLIDLTQEFKQVFVTTTEEDFLPFDRASLNRLDIT